jgi:hypothetical protein
MQAKQFNEMSESDCADLTRAIMAILDSWGLNGQAQMAVLNIPKGVPVRALRRYREGTAFPNEQQVYDRVEHIVGIADALRTSYPHNPAMGVVWLKQPNSRFQQRSPLQVIVEDGLEGLVAVRAHLDCSWDWQVNP